MTSANWGENCRKLEALLAEEGVRLVESLRGED